MSERHLTRTAVFVLLERNDQIFFLRRANTGWADGMLTVPAGHVDKGQGVKEAAVVEVREEALVDVIENNLEFVHADYIRDEYTNFYFRTTTWKGEPGLGEPHLASEAVWINKSDLPSDLVPQLRNLFEAMRSHRFFSDLDRV